MWGDSPHLKNVFIRVSRGVIITDRVGGTVPPRGQTRKVPRPQKFLNPIFSKTGRQILIKICRFVVPDHYWQMAKKNRTPQPAILRKILRKKILLGGAWPPNLIPYPEFYCPIL